MKNLTVLFMWPMLALASSPCDYQHSVTGQYTKEISKVENLKRFVFPHEDSTRKCVLFLDVWLDGKKYSTEGEFIFTADVSENTACKHAEQRAKENLIRKVSPELFSSTTNMICVSNAVNNKNQVSQPSQQANTGTVSAYIPQTVYQTPQYIIPQLTTPQIIGPPIIYTPPLYYYPPVYHTPMPNSYTSPPTLYWR